MSKIDTVISDFGGVLTTPLIQAFAAVQESHGIPLEAFGKGMALAAERDAGVQPLFELEKGAISERDFVAKLNAGISEAAGKPVDLDGYGDVFFSALHPNDELFAFMRELHGRGYRMAILTNNVREWEPLWRPMLPIDEIFELVIDSAFVGLRKPDPAIYELTLSRLGVSAESAIFIDDLQVNVEAARALGMHGVQFHDTDQAIAEIEAALDGGPPSSAS
ncbi:MAG TPA: HAD family phosphatase [Conexibacter sp.]|jgi:putative hydrolase of the HAD superfamily